MGVFLWARYPCTKGDRNANSQGLRFLAKLIAEFPHVVYRGTSPIRNCRLLPYSRTLPRVLGWSQGGGRFLMSEVALYHVKRRLGRRWSRLLGIGAIGAKRREPK